MAYLAPTEDRVVVPYHQVGGYVSVARWVLHPDPRLNILPIPEVGHAFGSCYFQFYYNPTGEDPTGNCGVDEPYDYFREGLGGFGTGPSSAATSYTGGLVLLQP